MFGHAIAWLAMATAVCGGARRAALGELSGSVNLSSQLDPPVAGQLPGGCPCASTQGDGLATAQVGRVSPRPQDHRQPIASVVRMLLFLAMVLDLKRVQIRPGSCGLGETRPTRAVARHYQKSSAPSVYDATLS
jgi:hypothetical protein